MAAEVGISGVVEWLEWSRGTSFSNASIESTEEFWDFGAAKGSIGSNGLTEESEKKSPYPCESSNALWTSQPSAIASSVGAGGRDEVESPESGVCLKACNRELNPWFMDETGDTCMVPDAAPLGEIVRLLLRGLMGSYSQSRPLSIQRSHEGRSSLHFFFFSLLGE